MQAVESVFLHKKDEFRFNDVNMLMFEAEEVSKYALRVAECFWARNFLDSLLDEFQNKQVFYKREVWTSWKWKGSKHSWRWGKSLLVGIHYWGLNFSFLLYRGDRKEMAGKTGAKFGQNVSLLSRAEAGKWSIRRGYETGKIDFLKYVKKEVNEMR